MNRCLALAVAVLSLASYVSAQTATGTIDGRVTDASGAAVPGASVTVENVATNVKQTSPTNAEGRFYQRYLLPGTYRVTIEKTGFERYVQSGVILDIEQTVTLTIPMKVGDVATSVEVQASAAQLSTESSTVTTTIGGKGILDLPIQGRSVVCKVIGKQAGDPAQLAAERSSVLDQLKGKKAGELNELFLDSVLTSLVADGKVKIHRDAIKTLTASYKR